MKKVIISAYNADGTEIDNFEVTGTMLRLFMAAQASSQRFNCFTNIIEAETGVILAIIDPQGECEYIDPEL